MNSYNNKIALKYKLYYDSEEFEKSFHYKENDLGVIYHRGYSQFKVWAPTASQVRINLYRTGDAKKGNQDLIKTIPMEQWNQGVWEICIKEDLNGVYYTYSLVYDDVEVETQDPYTIACGVNGNRSMILNFKGTDPEFWEQDSYCYDNTKQPIIYEVHIKDFSSNEHSGIPVEYRGKYKAFTIDASTLDDEGKHKTCISYLRELGITHVHLLPCFDFGSIDESKALENQFNWGYDPLNYNVPEGSYSTDPYDGSVRIREFKEMVQALHNAHIGVILDVVYNHTYSLDSCFQKTAPYYYYRIDSEGELCNGSVCGNDTASERFMFRKYMIDSILYWVQEYHIDGFRFDLMGLHDIDTMNRIRRALNRLPNGKNIMMYGEPWRGAETKMDRGEIPVIKENIRLLEEGIAVFCDNTRDAIKGSVFNEEDPGFINGKKNMEDQIKASVCAWCKQSGSFRSNNPGQIISYVSSHDNFTLWDKLNYTLKEIPEFNRKDEEILQANKMTAGIIMTCLGATFFQAGEEFGRTKQGIGDSYASPSIINELNWKQAYEFTDLIQYYKNLIKLRKEFESFRSKGKNNLKNICFPVMSQGMVGFIIDANNKNDKWKRLFVIYNANREKKQVRIKGNRWKIISDGFDFLQHPLALENKKQIDVNPICVTILGEDR